MQRPTEGRAFLGRPARFGLSVAAAFGAGIVTAIAVTVLDLYLTGHGHPSIGREVIDWPQAGVHLSPGDLAMLGMALAAALLVWRLTRDAK